MNTQNQQPAGGAINSQTKKPFYKKWWFITIAAIVVLSAIFGSSDDKKKDTASNQPQTQETEQQAPANNSVATNDQEVNIEYKNLGSYDKNGETWKSIVIPIGTTKEDLTKLAKDIHKKDAITRYHIFDDDAKYQEYKNWDMNYLKVRDKDGKIKQIDECADINYCTKLVEQKEYPYPFPEEWANKHEIGMINQMMDLKASSMSWQLTSPVGEKISDL